MKNKSLGMIVYPQITIENFSGSTGDFILRIEGSGKVIKIKSCITGVEKMVNTAREIVGRQKSYAISEWNLYKRLKEATGYKSPDGTY